MEEFRYDSYCGLYCGSCDILMAYRKGLETNTTPKWEDLPERVRNVHGKGEPPIICYGCKTDTVFKGCSICPVQKCARKKLEIHQTCLDCKSYPCKLHKLMNIARKLLRLNKKLPHSNILPKNVETIREKGLEYWLEEQKKIWECPDCHTAFSWYQEKCSNCGKDLEPIKDYNNLQ
jgi:hypothetical protein